MARHNEFGKWGEDLAARFLEERGFEILARNWRHEHKEVDNGSSSRQHGDKAPAASQQRQTAQAEPAPSPGCSMLCDDIRYDLLSGK